MTEDSPSTTAGPLTSSLTFEAFSCLIQQGNLLVFELALWRSIEQEKSHWKLYTGVCRLNWLHNYIFCFCFLQNVNYLIILPSKAPSPYLLSYIPVTESPQDREKNIRIREKQWFLEISNSVFYIVTHNHSFHPQVVSLWGLWLHPWHLLVQPDLCDISKFRKCRWC